MLKMKRLALVMRTLSEEVEWQLSRLADFLFTPKMEHKLQVLTGWLIALTLLLIAAHICAATARWLLERGHNAF